MPESGAEPAYGSWCHINSEAIDPKFNDITSRRGIPLYTFLAKACLPGAELVYFGAFYRFCSVHLSSPFF
jgi:hypothetical protein